MRRCKCIAISIFKILTAKHFSLNGGTDQTNDQTNDYSNGYLLSRRNNTDSTDQHAVCSRFLRRFPRTEQTTIL